MDHSTQSVVVWTGIGGITTPPWGPQSTRPEEQEAYDEEDIQALVCMHMMSDKEEQKSYEPGKDSWHVKKQPSQDVLQGDAAGEELGLARLVSSYTLPH